MRTGEERIRLYQKTMDDRARSLASGGMAVELLRSMEHILQGAVMMWPHESEVAEVTILIIHLYVISKMALKYVIISFSFYNRKQVFL